MTFNSFFETTCVIIVFAYLLTRVTIITHLGETRHSLVQTLTLGGVLGIAGILELYWGQERYPYDTYTLIITFATLQAGWRVGTLCALIVSIGALFFDLDSLALLRTILSLLITVLAGLCVRHLFVAGGRWKSYSPLSVVVATLIAITLSEAGSIAIRLLVNGTQAIPFSPSLAILKIVANGFGAVLLQTIVYDAQMRVVSERFQVEAERGRTLVAEASLSALRARIHPHFLFNTLNSIVALCRIDPVKAETATLLLSQIMRRVLEVNATAPVPLLQEIEHIHDYIEIEKLRLGERLHIEWKIDENAAQYTRVPSFALLSVVENAVLHGIGQKIGAGCVTIMVRAVRGKTLIAVSDDGNGITGETLAHLRNKGFVDASRPHGLSITTKQLKLVYGAEARLRLFSKLDKGTLVVFAVPNGKRKAERP